MCNAVKLRIEPSHFLFFSLFLAGNMGQLMSHISFCRDSSPMSDIKFSKLTSKNYAQIFWLFPWILIWKQMVPYSVFCNQESIKDLRKFSKCDVRYWTCFVNKEPATSVRRSLVSTEIKQNIKCFFVTGACKSRVNYWQGKICYLYFHFFILYKTKLKHIQHTKKIPANNNTVK